MRILWRPLCRKTSESAAVYFYSTDGNNFNANNNQNGNNNNNNNNNNNDNMKNNKIITF